MDVFAEGQVQGTLIQPSSMRESGVSSRTAETTTEPVLTTVASSSSDTATYQMTSRITNYVYTDELANLNSPQAQELSNTFCVAVNSFLT